VIIRQPRDRPRHPRSPIQGDPSDQGVTYVDGAASGPRRALTCGFRSRATKWRNAASQVLPQGSQHDAETLAATGPPVP